MRSQTLQLIQGNAMLVDVFKWSCIVNAAMSLAMACLALLSRPLSRVKVYWGLSCLAIAVWAVGVGTLGSAHERATALLGVRVCNAASIALTALLFHTIWVVIERRARGPLIASYVTATILFVANGFGALSTVAPAPPFAWYNSRLWPYDVFVAYFYFAFGGMVVFLWRESKRVSEPLRARQFVVLMVGIALGFLGGQTTVPLVYGIRFFPIGVLFVPLYIIVIGYGMFRYQLLDFRFVLRRIALVAIIYLTIATVLLPVAWPLIKSAASPTNVPLSLVALSLIVGVMIGLGPILYSVLLKKSFWLRSHLSVGLTHELRSPLHAIQGAVAVLRDQMDGKPVDPAVLNNYLDMIERNAARLDRYSTDLLTVAREEGIQDLCLRDCDLVDIARRAKDEHSSNARLKGLGLEVMGTAPVIARVDEPKILQAISNIVSNAIRFSDSGAIQVDVSKSEKECRVSVKDEGTGIQSEHLLQVFDRFFQGNPKRSGTGLGLTIAKAWVDAHGGRIWAESRGPGMGTAVTFTLPSAAPSSR